MVLYINCCPRSNSRTMRLAEKLLSKLGNFEEVNLEKENISPLNRERKSILKIYMLPA